MTPHPLTETGWFGTQTLAEDCAVPVVATRKAGTGEAWMRQKAEERILPAGTVLRMESATREAIFALVNGSDEGIAIQKTAIGRIVVQ